MKTSSTKKYIYSILGLFLVFFIWVIISTIKNDDYLFPSFYSIGKGLINIITTPTELSKLFTCFFRIMVTLIVCIVIATITSFIYFIFPNIIWFIRPIINIMKAIPFIIISVYLWIIFFNNRIMAVYILCFLVIYPIILEGLIAAIDNIDKEIKDELAMLPKGPILKFTKVYFPLFMPYVTMTILQSFGLGIKVMIMGEYLFSIENTLGNSLIYYRDGNYDLILAWLILIIILVCLIDFLIKKIKEVLLK